MDQQIYWYQPEECRQHLAYPGTAEKPDRHDMVELVRSGKDILKPQTSGPANYHQLRRAHSASYLDMLANTSKMSRFKGMRHALFSPHLQWYTAPFGPSFEAAKFAAGAVCAGVTDVLSEKTNRAFCAVRPPGHHAGESYGEGFCILNNVAIGALEALYLGARVAIIDFDRHHGNGTEEIITKADDSGLLFISSFQEDCKYAKDPMPQQTRSKLVRVPLPLGSNGENFLHLYNERVFPTIKDHRPDIILLSAGFDLHEADALKPSVRLKTENYRILTWRVTNVADKLGAGVVSVLEGGYTLKSLHDCVSTHIRGLVE